MPRLFVLELLLAKFSWENENLWKIINFISELPSGCDGTQSITIWLIAFCIFLFREIRKSRSGIIYLWTRGNIEKLRDASYLPQIQFSFRESFVSVDIACSSILELNDSNNFSFKMDIWMEASYIAYNHEHWEDGELWGCIYEYTKVYISNCSLSYIYHLLRLF